MAAGSEGDTQVVRAFNRFYTRRIGVLSEGHLDSAFSLTEVRLLYELAHRDGPSASELAADLGLDPGYTSRMLKGFRRLGLVETERSPGDARRSRLKLSRRGRSAFAALDEKADSEVAALLERLPTDRRRQLVAGMRHVQTALDGSPAPPTFVLRGHEPGDIGWVIHRHGVLYAKERGWDERFEALVARIAADFVTSFQPGRERCWIAERDGERVGSVFLVSRSRRVAQLRLLLIEPSARGFGLGARLVDECTRFARRAGYARIRLWTNGSLDAAIHIYRNAGYRLVEDGTGEEYGNQIWELDLTAP